MTARSFVFFDLDGTLADTDGDIRLAWKAALSDMKLACPRFDELFVAGPTIEAMAKTLFGDVYTDALGSELRRRFGEHYDGDGFPTTEEYPGVLDAVRRIKAAGRRVFIVTNKRWAGASAMARKFGWDRVFERLYTSDMHMDDPAIGKMDKPRLLAFVLRELGASPGECVMVGDTANDFNAARANGIASVAVPWGYAKPGELDLADAVVASPDGLLAALGVGKGADA